MQAELIILGSGTSMGVPTLGCDCRVCTSRDPRDRRLRPSVAVTWPDHCVLIDTGPDFREQALRHGIRHVDAVFYTHAHADHILGLDDLRPLSFMSGEKIPLYADDVTAHTIEKIFDYTFSPEAKYPHRARVELHRLEGQQSVEVSGVRFERIPLLHGELEIAGYRFGRTAYLTDMSSIPQASLPLLEDLDVAVIDALRRQPHPNHASLGQAMEWARKVQPRQAWFTHMSHDLHHADTDRELPPNMRLAYDGLSIPIEL